MEGQAIRLSEKIAIELYEEDNERFGRENQRKKKKQGEKNQDVEKQEQPPLDAKEKNKKVDYIWFPALKLL